MGDGLVCWGLGRGMRIRRENRKGKERRKGKKERKEGKNTRIKEREEKRSGIRIFLYKIANPTNPPPQ